MPDKQNNTDSLYAVGQRWISEMEPELGLGQIKAVDTRRITLSFHDGETVRIYSKENAPLRRVIFKPGDTIRIIDGSSFKVENTEEKQDGTIIYLTDKGPVDERNLSGSNRISAPLERLLSEHADSNENFLLRSEILDLRYQISNSQVRGFTGGRIELIPHQLYIANEVSSRYVRRVMLADEVGLGKTIEASLILHRLLISGRISQVMIVVPESMVNVWFVELLRKFNLLFSIVEKTDENPETINPFSEASLILVGMNHLINSDELLKKALEVEWDLLIVDEAHHLVEGTAEYNAIESLSGKSGDILFLTATPLHFGERNHFARLRMLDPSRYTDFEAFCKEAEEHRKIAEITGRILDAKPLLQTDIPRLQNLMHSKTAGLLLESSNARSISVSDRKELIAEIIDRQGIGRALFRNTRAAIGGFPEREVMLTVLEAHREIRENVIQIFNEDVKGAPKQKKRNYKGDPRISHISDLLKANGNEKMVVICRSKHSVAAIDEALQKVINVKTALFHEDLTLLQRDRNAAWFSEDEGARVLICSEIGSEGRNFQFASHLCLFDLPADPELVEQRIGRLDRIGQKKTVVIHVPLIDGTQDRFLAGWYHQGVGILETTIPAAQETFERFSSKIQHIIDNRLFENFGDDSITNLILETKSAVVEISKRLKAGRDRLLEQHSFRPKEAASLVHSIEHFDRYHNLKNVMRKLFKSRGILIEEFLSDTWNLLSESQIDETFPGLSPARSIITFSRSKALKREDYEFLTIDHPAVSGGIDLFLGSDTGNACYAVQKNSEVTALYIEAIFTAESIAPASLFVSRFLPPVVIHVLVDNNYQDQSALLDGEWNKSLENIASFPFIEKAQFKQKLIPAMFKEAQVIAGQKCNDVITGSLKKAKKIAGSEVERLRSLKKTNPSISDLEIQLAQKELANLIDAISKASPRLDALRLIWCPGEDFQNE